LFLGKSTETAATRTALFDSNMHQIVCRLGLHPRPHRGELNSAPPDLLAVFGGVLLKGGERRRGDGREGVFLLPQEEKKKSAAMGCKLIYN